MRSSTRTRRPAARLLWASGTHELPILGVVKKVEEEEEQVDIEIETERAFTQAFVSSAKNASHIRRSTSRDSHKGSRSERIAIDAQLPQANASRDRELELAARMNQNNEFTQSQLYEERREGTWKR